MRSTSCIVFRNATSRIIPRHLWRGGIGLALLLSTSHAFSKSGHPNLLKSLSWRNYRGSTCRQMCSPSISPTLTDRISEAYATGETDGILSLAQELDWTQNPLEKIVDETLEAAEGRKGEVASVLNSLIGSCCLLSDKSIAIERAQDLFEAFEELDEKEGISPDIVTFSLAFTVFHGNAEAEELAQYVLDAATRKSKKLAGAKRRKLLAATRRKDISTCTEAEEQMKILLGGDFSVLQETSDFLVVNKPSGTSCFHKKTTTSGKIKKGPKKKNSERAPDISLEAALLQCNVPLSTLNPEALGLVHRLDRGSSGCIVLAKTDEMHALLLAEFFLRRTRKLYSAVVAPAPCLEISNEGVIDSPVGNRPARSSYEVVERFGDLAAQVNFTIYTGRKHQIRVHAAESLNAPVLLDKLYGTDDMVETKESDPDVYKNRLCLHASQLCVPTYGIDVSAPTPSWWDEILQKNITK